ncbi:MAG TPA: hypothetical protein VIA06_09700 [Candidatus Dormibacteraeota bacterium]|nr:hypothetical protein [Candidatus Dormibacteraeota bacterium]
MNDCHRGLIAGHGTDPDAAHRSVQAMSGALSPDLFNDVVLGRIVDDEREVVTAGR